MNSDQWWVINNLFVYFLVYSAFSLINGSFKTRTQSPFPMWHVASSRPSKFTPKVSLKICVCCSCMFCSRLIRVMSLVCLSKSAKEIGPSNFLKSVFPSSSFVFFKRAYINLLLTGAILVSELGRGVQEGLKFRRIKVAETRMRPGSVLCSSSNIFGTFVAPRTWKRRRIERTMEKSEWWPVELTNKKRIQLDALKIICNPFQRMKQRTLQTIFWYIVSVYTSKEEKVIGILCRSWRLKTFYLTRDISLSSNGSNIARIDL